MRRSESAFTLIELLVAMVIGAIVLAMTIGIMVSVFGSSSRVGAKAKSQRSAVAAVELLTSDLRAARAPERAPRNVGSPDGLRDVLLNDAIPGLLAHDVLRASPTEVVFYAELFAASPREECVRWRTEASGALTRTVSAFTPRCAAPGAVLQTSDVMPARSAGAAASTVVRPFRYQLLVQPRPRDPNLDVSACRNVTNVTSPTGLQLDQIMSVSMDLRSFVAYRGGRGDQELNSTVSISSRQSTEYKYGIGCVA
ncbi:MAG: hypothetical protein JWM86_1744 [Thermoleophilia bacterium]|nr:hypothetical protein [Thermoleophilia bacterium]